MEKNDKGNIDSPSTPETDFKHKDAVIVNTDNHRIVKEESLEKIYNKKSAYQVDMVSIDLE